MKPGLFRTLLIVIALTAGAIFPQAHAAIGAVRWLIGAMLFMVFLQTRLSRQSVNGTHVILLAANFAMAGVGYGIGWFVGGVDVALAGFFAGITPTAIAAPVIISFLGGRVDYVVTAFGLTNLSVALALPIILPWVLGHPTPDVFGHVALTIGGLVFLPFVAGLLLRRVYPAAVEWPKRFGMLTFIAWNLSLFLIMAHASHYLRTQHEVPNRVAWQAILVSAGICFLNFGLGRLIGGKKWSREASQSLGQKNTTFTIYVALAHANPIAALGPTSYVLWHNLWNSWQLARTREEKIEKLKAEG